MSHQPVAHVTVLTLPHVHPDAIRIEIECQYSTTGLTSIPGPALAFTRPQIVTAAIFEHEARCGDCDTTEAHQRDDPEIRALADEARLYIEAALAAGHPAGRRN